MKLAFTTYQKIILTVYFVVGLPGLPFAILMTLMRRYILEDKNYFSAENRVQLIVEFCSYMIACAIFFGLLFGLVLCGAGHS